MDTVRTSHDISDALLSITNVNFAFSEKRKDFPSLFEMLVYVIYCEGTKGIKFFYFNDIE